MKRDHSIEGEQDAGINANLNMNNNNNGPGGPKRFRQTDEVLRVLIPSRVRAISVPVPIEPSIIFQYLPDRLPAQ